MFEHADEYRLDRDTLPDNQAFVASNEVDSGTLERLIGSRAGMSGVLAGKWIFIMSMGFLQLTVMFVWGALVFGTEADGKVID